MVKQGRAWLSHGGRLGGAGQNHVRDEGGVWENQRGGGSPAVKGPQCQGKSLRLPWAPAEHSAVSGFWGWS